MNPFDWDDAIQMSRIRSEKFPTYERSAMRVFSSVQEDDEPAILQRVEEEIKNKGLPDFHKCRLMTVIVGRLGKFY